MALNAPFALVVGPTKSGTTWVHAYLQSSKDVALPKGMKETTFFDKRYENGFDWYQNLFPPSDDKRLRVEVAPSLFHKPIACERAHVHAPFAKIICIVRNPFDRAVSHYFHYRKHGIGRQSLTSMASQFPDVIDSGLYAEHAVRWEQVFGQDQVFYLSYQQLCKDPAEFCRQLCGILEIEYICPDAALRDHSVNAAKVPRNLLAARFVRGLVNKLRAIGARRLVTLLKVIPVKKWLYSGKGDFAEEKAEVRRQAPALSSRLSEDWDRFTASARFPD